MLARIVGPSCVLCQGDRLREPRGPAWPKCQLLEHEDFRARPTVRLDEIHAKIDQQLLRRRAFVSELNGEGNGLADRGHGRCNVNVTYLDASRRNEAKDLQRDGLTSLHRRTKRM